MSQPELRPTTPIQEDNQPKAQENTNLISKKKEEKKLKIRKRNRFFSSGDKFSRLEKYEELDRNHPLNRPFQGDPYFRGPVFKRKYTNLIFVILFIAMNTGFFGFGVLVWKNGAPERLIRGSDFRAEICGVDKLESRPFLYYPIPTVDMNVRFCVKECPETGGQPICLYNETDPTIAEPFCYTQLETIPYGRYCLPEEPINRQTVDKELSSLASLIKRIAGDLGQTFDTMAVGIGMSIIIAAIYFKMLKSESKIKYVIWCSIWGTFIFITLAGLFCYWEYRNTIELRCIQALDRHNCGGNRAFLFWVLCWSCIGVAAIYMFVIMKIFNRINLGIGILQAVSKCSLVMYQMRRVPWVLCFLAIAVGVYFISAVTNGFSIGEIEVKPALGIDQGYVKIIVYDEIYRTFSVFAFFTFQLWLNIILLVSDTIISYSIAIWFFEKRKETVVLPVQNIIKIILRYHLGTIIMLALFKMIFRIPAIFMSLARRLLRGGKQNGEFLRFAQACCLCCVHSHERFFRYMNKHLIVQMCIWSSPFSTAAKRAFYVLFRHRHKIQNMDFLSTFLLFQSKLCCCLFGGVFVYFFISYGPYTVTGKSMAEVETPLIPALVVLYFGFFYASLFQNAFDIASKTIVQCYLMDYEMFVGEQRYVEKFISDFMEYYKKSLNIDDDDYAKTQMYVKGLKATLKPKINYDAKEEDPDAEENKKFDREVASSSSSEEEEDEPQQEESDDSSYEDDSEEDDEEDPRAKSKVVIKRDDAILSLASAMKTTAGTSQPTPLKTQTVRVKTPDDKRKPQTLNIPINDSDEDDSDEEDEDDDDDEEEHKSDPYKQEKYKYGASINDKMAHSPAHSHRSDMPLTNSPSSRSRIVEKNSSSNNRVGRDEPSLFGRSKLGNNSTMKLDFDDDEEGEMKYRL